MTHSLVKIPSHVAKDQLVRRMEEAKDALTKAVRIDQVKLVMDAAAAQEIFARRQQLGEEAISLAHNVKMLALARLGELLRPLVKAKGTRGQLKGTRNGSGGTALVLPEESDAPTLADLGITRKVAAVAQQLASLPPKMREEIAQREITMKEVKQWLAKKRQSTKSTYIADPSCKLIVGDFREKCQELDDASLDAIITDPPYPEEFVPLYEDLAIMAAKKLKPEGNCLVMTGQSHLPTVMELMGQHLKYQWTLAYFSPGSSVQVFGRHVKSNWKPVLWYTGGKCFEEHVSDTVISAKADKRFHAWGQNAQAMVEIVTRFTYAGALVLDPFLGGGATAAACKASGRQFIGIDIDQEAIDITAERLSGL